MTDSKRRTFLRWIAVAAGLTGGCSSVDRSSTDRTDQTGPRLTDAPTRRPTDSPGPSVGEETPSEASATALPPSTIERVAGRWPSYAFDAANTGVAPDVDGPSGDPRVQWRANTPTGFGAPVVADGTLVATTYNDLVGIDATDGSERWREYMAPEVSGFPSAVVDDGVVVVGDSLTAFAIEDGAQQWTTEPFDQVVGDLAVRAGTVYVCADGGVHAFDAGSGDRRWTTDVPTVESVHGPPAADDETFVARTDSDEPGLVALDTATGETRWQVTTRRDPSVPRLVGGSVLVGVGRSHAAAYDTPTVYEFDAETGERTPLFATAGRGAPDLAVSEDRVVVAERVTDPPDRPARTPTLTHGHTPTPGPDETPESTPVPKPLHVYGLDRDGTEQWSASVARRGGWTNHWEGNTPVVADGSVYVVLADGPVVALDLSTGERQWQVDAGRFGINVVGPAVVDGVLFAGGDGGFVAVA